MIDQRLVPRAGPAEVNLAANAIELVEGVHVRFEVGPNLVELVVGHAVDALDQLCTRHGRACLMTTAAATRRRRRESSPSPSPARFDDGDGDGNGNGDGDGDGS